MWADTRLAYVRQTTKYFLADHDPAEDGVSDQLRLTSKGGRIEMDKKYRGSTKITILTP